MAVGSDLAVVLRGQRADVAHLDHGCCKGREEGLLVSSKSVKTYVIVVAPGEEPLGGPQVFVVLVVECVGRRHIQIDEGGR